MYFNLGLVVLAAAVASASPGPLQALDKTDDFQTEMMAAHNFFRDQHGVEPLTWDDELAESAQNWADTCKIEQKTPDELGENLACMDPYRGWGAFVDMWGAERQNYNFTSPGFTSAAGHFTQIVWRGTTSVGCGWHLCQAPAPAAQEGGGRAKGYSKDPEGYYVVCRYNPAGNQMGNFTSNVARQVHGKVNEYY